MMHIFTDGSCINNGKKNSKGGIGVFFGDNDDRNVSRELTCDKITNQVAELTAISVALDIVKDSNDIVYIYSDSSYCINIFVNWIKSWEKNNWKKKDGEIKNLELIKEIYSKLKNLTVIFKHVRSHCKEPEKTSSDYYTWYGNFQADKLACNYSNQ
jgi:ribonuclease HI